MADVTTVECVGGPLDGDVVAVSPCCRRLFYAPAHIEHGTHALYRAAGEQDEDAVPEWARPRLTGRYYRASGETDVRWFPYG